VTDIQYIPKQNNKKYYKKFYYPHPTNLKNSQKATNTISIQKNNKNTTPYKKYIPLNHTIPKIRIKNKNSNTTLKYKNIPQHIINILPKDIFNIKNKGIHNLTAPEFNLTKNYYKLSVYEELVLSVGLQYIFTPENISNIELKKYIKEFKASLQNKYRLLLTENIAPYTKKTKLLTLTRNKIIKYQITSTWLDRYATYVEENLLGLKTDYEILKKPSHDEAHKSIHEQFKTKQCALLFTTILSVRITSIKT
jgi:hypothetical protein